VLGRATRGAARGAATVLGAATALPLASLSRSRASRRARSKARARARSHVDEENGDFGPGEAAQLRMVAMEAALRSAELATADAEGELELERAARQREVEQAEAEAFELRSSWTDLQSGMLMIVVMLLTPVAVVGARMGWGWVQAGAALYPARAAAGGLAALAVGAAGRAWIADSVKFVAVMGYLLLAAGGAAKGSFAALLALQLTYSFHGLAFFDDGCGGGGGGGSECAAASAGEMAVKFVHFHLLSLCSVAFYVWVVWFNNETNAFVQRPKRVQRSGKGGVFFVE